MYLIDGHNLIGFVPDIALDDPNDEALLVQKLISFTARTKKQCVVVFDYGLPGGTSRMSTRSVQVVFASQRSNADKVIIARIGKIKDALNWTIVTSDREVRAIARGRNMSVLTSEEFSRLLESPPEPVIDVGEAVHLNITAEEVDEWLKVFGDYEPPPPAKPKLRKPPPPAPDKKSGKRKK